MPRVERIVLPPGNARCRSAGCGWPAASVVAADAVVVNPDLPVAYRTLLPGLEPPRVVRRGRYSPSALVWHIGGHVELPAGAEHHNIHFGADWDSAFRAVLRDGKRMPDPSTLVSVPSLHEAARWRRPDRHVLYVLEPVPNLDGDVDWTTERTRARDQLARRMDALGYRVGHRGRGAG